MEISVGLQPFPNFPLKTFWKMLTPKFKLDQDQEFLFISIHCPFIKAQEVEIDISGTDFRFYCHPYFLRLHLPAPLVENGKEKSSYCVDSGDISLSVPKLNFGEHFKDLDMLTKLLDIKQERKVADSRPKIEMMDGDAEFSEDVEVDWNFQQTPQPEILHTSSTYGFNNLYSGYSSTITVLTREILDLDDLEFSTEASRRETRILSEDLKFDSEHYMFDYLLNDEMDQICKFIPLHRKLLDKIQKDRTNEKSFIEQFFGLNSEDREVLVKLPNKSCDSLLI
jgi:protein SHQ1